MTGNAPHSIFFEAFSFLIRADDKVVMNNECGFLLFFLRKVCFSALELVHGKCFDERGRLLDNSIKGCCRRLGQHDVIPLTGSHTYAGSARASSP